MQRIRRNKDSRVYTGADSLAEKVRFFCARQCMLRVYCLFFRLNGTRCFVFAATGLILYEM